MEITDLKEVLAKLYITNNKLRKEYSGLYVASLGENYVNYVWIRDVYYQAKPSLKTNPDAYIQTYRSLLDYFKGLNYKYDNKIDHLIKIPFPVNNIRFIHPRFYPDLTEITGNWGNLQLDTFGYFFLGIAEGIKHGLAIIRDESDNDIINKLIKVLYKIGYWNIQDNGIWEEPEELHASSLGAILAGLTAIEEAEFIVPRKLFIEGYKRLNELLPRESATKDVDLALLTLIYPFNIITEDTKKTILANVHAKLERERGLARYVGDKYYNVNGEAEWTFGLAYLFFAYVDTDPKLAEKYLFKLVALMDSKGYIPELYYAKTAKPNDNNPLGWAVSMTILAIERYVGKKD